MPSKEANEYIFDFEPKLNEQRKQMIMEAKPSMQYIELTDEEIAVFREKAKPLRQKYLTVLQILLPMHQ